MLEQTFFSVQISQEYHSWIEYLKSLIVTYYPHRVWNIAMNVSVCLSVCLSARISQQELIRRWDSERELLVRWYLTRTSKYSPLLNIQHDAGCRQTRQWRRELAWPRGITVTTVPRFSRAPTYCNEVRFEVILPEYHLTTGEFLSLTPSLGVIHCEYCHK